MRALLNDKSLLVTIENAYFGIVACCYYAVS